MFPDYLSVSCGSASTDKNYDMEELETMHNYFENPKVGMFFLIGICSMQGWTATTKHGVTRKRSPESIKHTEKAYRKSV